MYVSLRSRTFGTSVWACTNVTPRRTLNRQKRCHDAVQRGPTPLLLQYVVGDLNALRQDLHGELAFPEPDHDFIGDEYVLTACQVALRSCRCAGAVLPLSPCTTVP
jgi:hypothetical protein